MLTFAKALEQVQKDQPGVSAVHVPSAGGGEPKKQRARSFKELFDKAAVPGIPHPHVGNRTGRRARTREFTERPNAANPIAATTIRESTGWARKSDDTPTDPPAAAGQPRTLKPLDDETSHSPFPYDPGALGRLRDDQVPRFFGALTDPDRLPEKTVKLSGLSALQNRVHNGKVQALRGGDGQVSGKKPVVVHMGERDYIADGHHRLTADWLDGKDESDVRYLDLSPVTNAMKRDFAVPFSVAKADPDQRLVFGWASIAKVDGRWVVDKQGDAIPVEELEKAAYEFVLKFRENDDMHVGGPTGRCVESMVFTPEKAALGLVAKDDQGREITGWWTGFYIDDDDLWKAHREGRRPEFSIGGTGVREEMSDADLA